MQKISLEIDTPAWAEPLIPPAPYKGASGGRASGKSHFFAELAVEEMVADPSLRFVCIREVQRSLKYSAKTVIEDKILKLGVREHFDVLATEIRRRNGTGVMIFQGMQDHTADSIKSLEGFGRAWIEEAQSLSQRSLDLLLPTIRKAGSEVWFSWNPDQPTDPVDRFFADGTRPGGAAYVHCDYTQNPWCPERSKAEADRLKRVDPDGYAHIWLGRHNVKSDAIVLANKWAEDEFAPSDWWDGPYFGADWGFAQDPTVLVKCWVADGRLWIEHDVGGVELSTAETGALFRKIPGADAHVIRSDSARPETIAALRPLGFNTVAAPKWSGSVEDGINHLRSYDKIVIHPRCKGVIDEARLWRYKTDRLTGDVLPKLMSGNDHRWDAVRYALAPLIQKGSATDLAGVTSLSSKDFEQVSPWAIG